MRLSATLFSSLPPKIPLNSQVRSSGALTSSYLLLNGMFSFGLCLGRIFRKPRSVFSGFGGFRASGERLGLGVLGDHFLGCYATLSNRLTDVTYIT